MGLPLQDGCKLPCTMAANCLAQGLQATLHGVYKPACTRCARKSAFPEAVVGANDYSPLREGHMIEVLRHPQSLRCVTHKACVVSPTKPALCHPQSLRCVTHKACVASPTKPALSVSHWEGCLPRCGEGVSPEAGRVSPPRREGCLPRGGKGVFLEAGRVSSSKRGECLPRGGEGVSPEAGKWIPYIELTLTEINRGCAAGLLLPAHVNSPLSEL